jgi:hypothetical protein
MGDSKSLSDVARELSTELTAGNAVSVSAASSPRVCPPHVQLQHEEGDDIAKRLFGVYASVSDRFPGLSDSALLDKIKEVYAVCTQVL